MAAATSRTAGTAGAAAAGTTGMSAFTRTARATSRSTTGTAGGPTAAAEVGTRTARATTMIVATTGTAAAAAFTRRRRGARHHPTGTTTRHGLAAAKPSLGGRAFGTRRRPGRGAAAQTTHLAPGTGATAIASAGATRAATAATARTTAITSAAGTTGATTPAGAAAIASATAPTTFVTGRTTGARARQKIDGVVEVAAFFHALDGLFTLEHANQTDRVGPLADHRKRLHQAGEAIARDVECEADGVGDRAGSRRWLFRCRGLGWRGLGALAFTLRSGLLAFARASFGVTTGAVSVGARLGFLVGDAGSRIGGRTGGAGSGVRGRNGLTRVDGVSGRRAGVLGGAWIGFGRVGPPFGDLGSFRHSGVPGFRGRRFALEGCAHFALDVGGLSEQCSRKLGDRLHNPPLGPAVAGAFVDDWRANVNAFLSAAAATRSVLSRIMPASPCPCCSSVPPLLLP